MPITPGECGFTVIAGVTIPTCLSFTAKDCILVNKVYDQCFTEELATSGSIAIGTACPGITIPPGSSVLCSPITGSATCTFAGTVAVTPTLTPFFEEVFVLNSFLASVTIVSPTGVTLCTPTVTLSAAARANLWVPPGTTVTCDILSFGDCTCTLLTSPAGLPTSLACVGKICKEIQVTASVKLLVPTYGFCEVPACTFSAQPGFACLPQPLFPPERCQVPPTVTFLNFTGAGIPGVTFTTPTATHVSGANGVITLPEQGAFFCTGTFTITLLGKTFTFTVPCEFVDVAGVAHDSSSVCSVVFRQAAPGATIFTVQLNGFLLGIPGSPGVPFTIDP